MTSDSKTATRPLGLQYFFYFGTMGVFLPYFNLYLKHIGFSSFQIGAVFGLRTLSMVFFSLLWGLIADRYSIRKPVYIFLNFMSCLVFSLYLTKEDFMAVMAITFFYSIFFGPVIAFLEAFTMDNLGEKGKKKYGYIRVWGSLNFIIVSLITGKLIDFAELKIILVLILTGSIAQFFFSFSVPDRNRSRVSTPFLKNLFQFMNWKTIVFLFCTFVMLASHGTYYGFFSIHLKSLGFSNTFIGSAWALASLAEIFIMIRSDFIFRRFSIRSVLVFSFGAASIRWLILYFAVTPWMILFAQALHALTYGAFHIGCVLYIDRLSPEGSKTFGQVTNNAVSYGLGMMAGFMLNGIYYETAGSKLFLASSCAAFLGGVVFFVSSGSNRYQK